MRMRLATLGFGNVGQALAVMLAEKADALRRDYGLTVVFTGGLTRRGGGWIAREGIAAAALAAAGWPGRQDGLAALPGVERFDGSALEFVARCPADVTLELTTLNPQDGQPATEHIRAALRAGRHVVTANKGPIAYAYRELRALAAEQGVALRFESTVMDGTPIFGMVEASLPVTVFRGFRGLLNSTSNYVLGRMSLGETLEEAVMEAQRQGVAEADPRNDLEGWDAAVKATVLANVLMGAELRPMDVRRVGLGAEAMRAAQAALPAGRTLKQVVTVERSGGGVGGAGVTAQVRLEALDASDLFGRLSGMEAALLLRTDTMQDLTIVEGEGGPGQTAFGVVADLVAIARRSDVVARPAADGGVREREGSGADGM